MDFIKFKSYLFSLQSEDKESVFILSGDEPYFLECGLTLIKEKFNVDPVLDYDYLDGGDCNFDEIISGLSSFSFLGGIRIVVIKEFYPTAEQVNKLAEVLKDNSNLLVVLNSKAHATFEKLPSKITVICDRATLPFVREYILEEAHKHYVTISTEDATTIAEFCLCDMVRVENEVKKLIALSFETKTITNAMILDVVKPETEYKIYELTDFIAKKKVDKSLAIIFDLLGKGETPQRLIQSIYNYFRKLLFVSISDMSVAELSKALSIKEFAVKKTLEQAKLFKKKDLKNIVDDLVDADFKIKSGKVDALNVLNYTVLKIMTK